MNGGADLGGMMGFGPVVQEENELNFHAAWEERVLGMTVALGACGLWNIDQSRFARENMQPADYMKFSYYQIWLCGITNLLKKHNMINEAELASGQPSLPPVAIKRKLLPDDVMPMLMAGGPANREEKTAASFSVGQQVQTINAHPSTHTRLPRYARDKTGVIKKIHGVHVFPDSSAQGLGDAPTWLYQVSFSATSLWGEDKSARDTVSLDLWQPYLKAVS